MDVPGDSLRPLKNFIAETEPGGSHAPAPHPPPPRIGKYELVREVGRGGMALVYEAVDPDLKRRVALKILRDERMARRLHREATAAAQLRHPHIVAVHDVGVATNGELTAHYIVMDFVDGPTLAEVVHKMPLRERLEILETLAGAVGYAHHRGVVHRDLKPYNVLMAKVDGQKGWWPYLTDFGLARLGEGEDLTRTGVALGTPHYMAPEQAMGRKGAMGPWTDVWALGVMLYEFAADCKPFQGNTPLAIYERIVCDEPPPIRRKNPNAPRDLETIAAKALQREPRWRYADAEEFARDLRRFLDGEPIQARRTSATDRIRRGLARRKGMVLALAALLATAAVAITTAHVGNRRLAAARAEGAGIRQRQRLLDKIRPLEALMLETRPWFYVKQVDIREKLGRVEDALGELERLAREPQNERVAELQAALGMGWYFVGETRRAEEALLKAEALGSTDTSVGYYLGRIYVERAMEAKLIRHRPDQVWGDRERCRTWMERALPYLESAAARGWRWSEPIDEHLRQAYIALARNDAPALSALCEEGKARFGDRERCEEYFILGIQCAKTREEQIALLDQAIERRPHGAWAYLLRGIARNACDTQGAIMDFTQALEIRPKYVLAHVYRGDAAMKLGETAAAEADYSKAIALDPASSLACEQRAELRRMSKDRKGAIADLTRAIELDPNNAWAYAQRGFVHAQEGDYEAAVADCNKATEVDSQYAFGYFYRAETYFLQKDHDRALTDAARGLELGPSILGYMLKAKVLAAKNDLEGSLEASTEALRVTPSMNEAFYVADAHAIRGHALLSLSRPQEALADLDEALRIGPPSWPNREWAQKVLCEARRMMDSPNRE
ncbi:MAG: tetratricopeptide repeat protein [Planctomycetes bacterium]|nr:tetratricopeptide repeat protein [Planctomycetota bacterium]